MLQAHKNMLKGLLPSKVLMRELGIDTSKCHGVEVLNKFAANTSKELLACLEGTAACQPVSRETCSYFISISLAHQSDPGSWV
jgi:hypothetical protein